MLSLIERMFSERIFYIRIYFFLLSKKKRFSLIARKSVLPKFISELEAMNYVGGSFLNSPLILIILFVLAVLAQDQICKQQSFLSKTFLFPFFIYEFHLFALPSSSLCSAPFTFNMSFQFFLIFLSFSDFPSLFTLFSETFFSFIYIF